MSEFRSVTPDFLTQHQVAEKLQVPERTLEDWRMHHVGPPFTKLGRPVRYADVDVAEWAQWRGRAPIVVLSGASTKRHESGAMPSPPRGDCHRLGDSEGDESTTYRSLLGSTYGTYDL